MGFSGGSVVKNMPANAEDVGSVSRVGRSLRERKGNPLHYFCQEIPWREEPGGIQYMGTQRGRHDQATKHSTHTIFISLSDLLHSSV